MNPLRPATSRHRNPANCRGPRRRQGAAAEWLKERICSTITMLAVVVALAGTEDASRWDAAAVVIATAAALWPATLVADDQAHRAVHGRAADRRERPGCCTSPAR
ncbi:hypothetical protein [Streptomyces sp. NPDC047108]|uniref:hypothetical protein n=1 Tax=Streptomyces sp. NPDC047108 TaxID=3155025 RepID=UPI0033D2073D